MLLINYIHNQSFDEKWMTNIQRVLSVDYRLKSGD